MLAYYINILIIFSNYILYCLSKLAVFDQNFYKVILLVIVILLIKFLIRPAKTRFNKISLVKQYRINLIYNYSVITKKQKIISWLYIITYLTIFCFGFFILRLLNRNITINLHEIFINLYQMFITLGWKQNILNSLIIISCSILILIILKKIKNHFYFQIIRQHIYFSDKSWYSEIFYYLRFNIIGKITSIVYNFVENCICYIFMGHWKLNFKLDADVKLFDMFYNKYYKTYHRVHKIRKYFTDNFHIIILSCVFMYDLFFCNFVLIYTFKILPYVFLCNLYLTFARFIETKDLSFDKTINLVFYHDFQMISKKFAMVDGEMMDYKNWLKDFLEYSSNGFETKF